jgi:hypothetical protein
VYQGNKIKMEQGRTGSRTPVSVHSARTAGRGRVGGGGGVGGCHARHGLFVGLN